MPPWCARALRKNSTKAGWRVIDDPTIERGGCKVDTASNQIDATVASRWQRLSLALGKDIDWID